MARRHFRTRDSYARRGPTREPYDAVLIICEGGKTEPHYFEGLKSAHRLSSTNIAVQPMGRDPLSLVDRAITELERDPDLTHAYCVFDRDAHATYGNAVRKASDHTLGKIGRLRLAVSIPCFEVWPLLHFAYSTAAIVGGGGKTPGEKALADLQKVMPDYSKSDRRIFDKLAPKLDDALRHAARLARHNRESDSDNPSTGLHELVEYLIRLKK
jgi:hypothetical protein